MVVIDPKSFTHPTSDFGHAKRVVKSGMKRAWIHHESHSELVNPSEALENRSVHKIAFAPSQSNESVNRITNLARLTHWEGNPGAQSTEKLGSSPIRLSGSVGFACWRVVAAFRE